MVLQPHQLMREVDGSFTPQLVERDGGVLQETELALLLAAVSRGHMPPLHSIALLVAFTRCTSNPTSFAL